MKILGHRLPDEVFALVAPLTRTAVHSGLWRLDLDDEGYLLSYDQILERGADTLVVHPRAVFEGAMNRGATQIVLAHNHPWGTLDLHAGDHMLTEIVAAWGELLQVRLLDHIVVTDRERLSYREEGLL